MQADLSYSTLDSTMLEYERLRAALSDDAGLIVQAGVQRSGIGRNERFWHSPKGGLWITMDIIHPEALPSFALYVGSCLHRLLIELYSLADLRIKWTNDIYYQEYKLAGILCKYNAAHNRYVIGIGINFNNMPDSVLDGFNGISLKTILGFDVSLERFKRLLLRAIHARTEELYYPQSFLAYCSEHLYGWNRFCTIDIGSGSACGIIQGLDCMGNLLLASSDGEPIRVSHGSILEIV
ncbi:MAG: biotin--[acetyl-CoA-carboxylase] ligase [Candidatus Cloacimonadaceae bacterium]|nr:biotin--[acetyl-CoA-carboxylase] ligase [Candidatus Cloacimonadaceae bacterium]